MVACVVDVQQSPLLPMVAALAVGLVAAGFSRGPWKEAHTHAPKTPHTAAFGTDRAGRPWSFRTKREYEEIKYGIYVS